MRFAFTVERYASGIKLIDPRYSKLLVRQLIVTDGVPSERVLSVHKCSDADYDLFPEPSKSSEATFKTIRDDPERGFYCLDPDINLPLQGTEKDANYQNLEIIMVPCNYVHPDTTDQITSECIED